MKTTYFLQMGALMWKSLQAGQLLRDIALLEHPDALPELVNILNPSDYIIQFVPQLC